VFYNIVDMKKRREEGFLEIIIIIILLLVILSLLGVNLRILWENQIIRDNFKFVWDAALFLWSNYLKPLWGLILGAIKG